MERNKRCEGRDPLQLGKRKNSHHEIENVQVLREKEDKKRCTEEKKERDKGRKIIIKKEEERARRHLDHHVYCELQGDGYCRRIMHTIP